jgi:hypothetical protein
MFQKHKIRCIVFILSCFQLCSAQEIEPKKDSSKVYRDIQLFSKKYKFTKFLHRLIFRPIDTKQKIETKVIAQNYQSYEGKIIRRIKIVTLDPFGFSEIDSTKKPRNWAEKSGNSIHIKTKKLAVRNVLLIKENRPLDSLLVKESLRLIRAQSFINRVDITPRLIAKDGDSVDISIRVLDTWSLIPRVSITNSNTNLQLNERNFFGSGHTLNSQYQKRSLDQNNAYNLEYVVPNIKNTFIRTAVLYKEDLDNNFKKSISIDRPFFSPFAKWAGGVHISQQIRNDSLADVNLLLSRQRFKFNTKDFWAGYAFRIMNSSTEESRVTNLILSARYLNLDYLERPSVSYDPVDFFSSERFFLSGIGVSTRKFVQSKYIFRNGIIEDIPIGRIFGITGGYQFKNRNERFYLGGQASYGNYFKWGFLSFNLELGTFFNKSVNEQSGISFQVNYFTNLFDIGKWKLRQFIKPQVTYGLNRLNSIGDQLNINEELGIQGFKNGIYGNKKMMLTFQTQTYSPWNVFGFRLNPYLNYTISMLGNEQNRWIETKVFSKIGLGFIITNDYLVFSSFQISFSYFPTIPGNGNNVFKTNALETSDFGFQNFELDKPRTVIYK